jgi:hypothetical protein
MNEEVFMRENQYQAELIKRLRSLFPECVNHKNDSSYMPGVPDLLILYYDRWAMLEVKAKAPRSASDFEPNQEYYIDLLDRMSFAACIYPANEEETLSALQSAFTARRQTRLSKRK